MAKISSIVVMSVLVASIFLKVDFVSAETTQLNISASASVIMDAKTGQILFDKNMHQRRPQASTTKIMTAILALESGELEQEVKVSPKAASIGESSIHLQPKEKLTLEELLYGAMMRSGNDACVAIAEHIAGTEENFVNFMNYSVKMLGGYDTNFCNTNGLPAENHYSSAYDLALLTRYAMLNTKLCDIVQTKYKKIDGPNNIDRYLRNTNKLLWSYLWADGVKTGTTNAAGCCLVASATKNGRHLISVVLHSNDRYGDTVKLLNYGFRNYEEIVVSIKGEHFTTANVEDGYSQNVPIIAGESLVVLVPKGERGVFEQRVTLDRNLIAPVRSHKKVGSVKVLIENHEVGVVDLLTGCAVDKMPKHLLIYQKLRKHL